MMYTRGNRRDYDFNLTGWTWKDIEPYFLRYEQLASLKYLPKSSAPYHNTSGVVPINYFGDSNNPWHKRFPKDPNLRDTWKKFCNNRLTWMPTRNSVICSNHFKTSDFQVLANNRRKLVEGDKPTLTPHCICPSHQQSFTLADDRLSSYDAISATLTITDSSTSPCTSSTPQNAQSTETSKKYSSIPTIPLTPRKRKMQKQIDGQKKKLKGSKLKIFS